MNGKVDEYLNKTKKWQAELKELRAIVLSCKLTEEFKWGKPCYTVNGANTVILYGFKESCAVGFFKGALLKDAKGILVKPGDNSQSMRFIKFTDIKEIVKMRTVLKKYIKEAADAEKAGLKVDLKKKKKLMIPEEFQSQMNKNRTLKNAFEALTPGRQRAYVLYFSGAKQPETREARVHKYSEKILNGKGLND